MKTENIELAIRTMYESMPKSAMDAFAELAELKRLAEIGSTAEKLGCSKPIHSLQLFERQTIALERIAEAMTK